MKQTRCSACNTRLIGSPFNRKGQANKAWLPDIEDPSEKGEPAKINLYGGFVCKPECDIIATQRASSSYSERDLTEFELGFIKGNWG